MVFIDLPRCLISYLQFAIVQLPGLHCPIKSLILVWNDKQKKFTGLIHLDQVTIYTYTMGKMYHTVKYLVVMQLTNVTTCVLQNLRSG